MAYAVPAIMLASIAMEESTCNADNVGGAGEQGIMQITADKCPNQQAGAAWYVSSTLFIFPKSTF